MSYPIPDGALDADIAILGKKGRGKTYAAKGIVERLLGMGRRVVVLDPLSVWWGLKASADGSAGFPVAVFGGPHADMPLVESMGRPLARVLAAENVPAVLDMGEMRKAAWQRLVADFLDELFAANRGALTIVLEEADVFAPQQPREGDSARVLGEVDRIARRGRAYGFRLISITQRPARLHKDVLTQLSTLVALGLTSPQDRDAIKAWVEGNADRDVSRAVMDSLARLPVGEAWIWAPDFDILRRAPIPPIRTLDTSATPKAGERPVEPKTLAEVDLTAVRAALAEALPETPAAPAPASADDLRAAYERGLQDGEERGRTIGIALGIARLRAAIDALPIDGIGGDAASDRPAPGPPVPPANATAPVARSQPASRPAEAGALNSAARKMLGILDTNPPVSRTWQQVASLAGLRARGGHFNAGRRALLDGDLVKEEGGLVRIATPSSGAPAPTSDPAALVETWASVLSGAAPQILRELFALGGEAHREAIAERLGLAPRGGHWNAAWKELRDNGIVDMGAGGGRAALTTLFRPSKGSDHGHG